MSLQKYYAFQEIAQRAFNSLHIPRKELTLKNHKILSHGIYNYNQILPFNAGKSNYGFFRAAEVDNRSDHNIGKFTPIPPNDKRIARVYIQDDSHMHLTPTLRKGYKWNVQFENAAQVRLPFIGWTYTTDTLNRHLFKFPDLESALEFCQNMGVGYQVQYPRFRYATKRSYADNFKWKGFAIEDPDS